MGNSKQGSMFNSTAAGLWMCIIGFFCTTVSMGHLTEYFAHRSWSVVKANVTNGEIRRISGKHTSYQTELEYEFAVNNVRYQSAKAAIESFGREEAAQEDLNKHLQGLPVTAYYNPSNPAVNTANSPSKELTTSMVFGVLAMLLLFVGGVVYRGSRVNAI